MDVIKGKEPTKADNSYAQASTTPTPIQAQVELEKENGYGDLPEEIVKELQGNTDEDNQFDSALKGLAEEMGVELEGQGDKPAKPKEVKDGDDEPLAAKEDDDDELSALKKELTSDEAPKEDNVSEEDLVDLGDEKVSREQLKKERLFQKDYTKKTMELADERRAFEKEKQAYVEDYENRINSLEKELNQKKQIDQFLDYLEATDPERYNEYQELFESSQKQMRNPFFESKLSRQEKQIEDLNKKIEEAAIAQEVAKYQQGMLEVKRYAKKFEDMGLKWDEKAVAKEWEQAADAPTPLKAFKRIYGDQILTLAESKAKLAKTQGKRGMPNIGSMKSTGKSLESDEIDFKKISYSDLSSMLLSGKRPRLN